MDIRQVAFTTGELERYNRHFIIPGFGMEGQQKLKSARVLVVGCGGLGSPLLLYLAAAGVGTIGIADADIVSENNLQRQVLFGQDDLGQPKTAAAKRRLQKLNPHIEIISHNLHLDSQNALDIIREYDVVADGTDNFATRYLLNDACVLLDKPDVYAAVLQFEGQVSVFNYRNKKGEPGPNYRDLYPIPPAAGQVPDCATAGVLGVLPGIIGSLQALEIIKVVTGAGEPLSGRLYLFDGLQFESRTIRIKRDPSNPLNGTHPTITALIDYQLFCGEPLPENDIPQISPTALKDWQAGGEDFQLIDVREAYEYELVNIGADLIPLPALATSTSLISRDKKVVLHCKTGGRSTQAIRLLRDKFGFTNVYNLSGGILAYIDAVRPDLNKY